MIINELLEIRKALGMSRSVFAKFMAKSVCSIKFYETNRQKIPAEVIKRARRLKNILELFIEDKTNVKNNLAHRNKKSK